MKIRILALQIIPLLCFLFSFCSKKGGIEVNVTPKPCEKKDEICSSAIHSLTNKTKKGIQYSWGSSSLNRNLAPGQTHTMIVSEAVKVTYNRPGCQKTIESSSSYGLYTSIGIFSVEMDHCTKKSTFRYEENDTISVDLYDESE